MDPKRKNNCHLRPSQPLPLVRKPSGELHRFTGTFNGLCVTIASQDDMNKIISMGYFGKASLSRNYPEFQKHSQIIRKRVFQNRQRNKPTGNRPRKVIVVPDSDSDTDTAEYFTNLKPEFHLDQSGISENVNLGLEEAFFLAAALNCLDVVHQDKILKVDELWTLFKENDKFFPTNYVAYYHFRAKNWVVKPGIKFGGDFLLYKQGPPFYHGSYVVIIHCVDENLKIIDSLRRRSMANLKLMGLHRLCETAGKELLICQVIVPTTDFTHRDLDEFAIKETIMKRWKQTSDTKN